MTDASSSRTASSDTAFSGLVQRIVPTVLGTLAPPPRLAVAQVRDGEVVHFWGDHATVDTRFRIASMTKSFTAAAVVKLRDQGVWRLDDPISRWVPETIGLVGPTSDSPAITLRHLISMASGLATDDPWGDRQLDLDPIRFGALMRSRLSFATVPGDAMQYSNLGYALLGEAIARATRVPAQRWITHHLLEPLTMHSTGWDVPPPGADAAMPEHRLADLTEGAPLADGSFATMGGLWSTVGDLAKWANFFADSYPPRDGADSPVLSRASRREMQSVHTSWPPKIVDTRHGPRLYETGYGFGLMIGEHPTLGKIVNHSGGLPGYGSNMRWIPDSGVGFVALANRTYSPMRSVTLELVEALASHPVLSTRVRRWPQSSSVLDEAVVALTADFFGSPTPQFAATNLAENVHLDLPLDRRLDEVAAIRAQAGVPGPWTVEAHTATSGTATAQSASHTFSLKVLLTPEAHPRVQSFELTAVRRPVA